VRIKRPVKTIGVRTCSLDTRTPVDFNGIICMNKKSRDTPWLPHLFPANGNLGLYDQKKMKKRWLECGGSPVIFLSN